MKKRANEMGTMILGRDEYAEFERVRNTVYSMRHGLCADSSSWYHFASLAAAACYRRAAPSLRSGKRVESDALANEVQNFVCPYVKWVFRQVRSEKQIEEDLRISDRAVRGVPGREVPSLAEKIVIRYVGKGDPA